ncbi:MAG: YczE/YyaS/YitT family protein [Oscillospiraceae bacterium]
MNKNLSYLDIFLKILLMVISSCIIGLGVFFLLFSKQGADPFLVLISGISVAFNISTGLASILANFVMFLTAFIFSRKYIYLGTIITAFTVGPFIDFWFNILNNKFTYYNNLSLNLFYCILGLFIISFGVGLSVSLRFGFGPSDCILFKLKGKTKIDYKYLKIINDMLFIILGFSSGGIVGLGTILAAIISGPIIELSIKISSHFILKPLNINDSLNNF